MPDETIRAKLEAFLYLVLQFPLGIFIGVYTLIVGSFGLGLAVLGVGIPILWVLAKTLKYWNLMMVAMGKKLLDYHLIPTENYLDTNKWGLINHAVSLKSYFYFGLVNLVLCCCDLALVFIFAIFSPLGYCCVVPYCLFRIKQMKWVLGLSGQTGEQPIISQDNTAVYVPVPPAQVSQPTMSGAYSAPPPQAYHPQAQVAPQPQAYQAAPQSEALYPQLPSQQQQQQQPSSFSQSSSATPAPATLSPAAHSADSLVPEKGGSAGEEPSAPPNYAEYDD